LLRVFDMMSLPPRNMRRRLDVYARHTTGDTKVCDALLICRSTEHYRRCLREKIIARALVQFFQPMKLLTGSCLAKKHDAPNFRTSAC
jgi:hypothetical protein